MIQPSNIKRVLSDSRGDPSSAETESDWKQVVAELLADAAALCVEHDIDVDAFMRNAWAAYVESRPGMREYLEDLQLQSQLEEIRKAGRMGQA